VQQLRLREDFIADIMLFPRLSGSTLTLMDIDKERLDLAAAYANKMVEQNKLNLKVESTTDRRAAVDGADYVITSIRPAVGGQPGLSGKLPGNGDWKSNPMLPEPAVFSRDWFRSLPCWISAMTWKKFVPMPG